MRFNSGFKGLMVRSSYWNEQNVPISVLPNNSVSWYGWYSCSL